MVETDRDMIDSFHWMAGLPQAAEGRRVPLPCEDREAEPAVGATNGVSHHGGVHEA